VYGGPGEDGGGYGVAAQVRVARCGQLPRVAGHLSPDLGDGQWHVRGIRERFPDLAAALFVVARDTVGVKNAPVSSRVGLCKGHDPAPQFFRPVGDRPGVVEILRREPGGHGRKGGGEGNGHSRRRAPAGRRLAGGHHVQKAGQRQFCIVRYDVRHESPTTSPFSSMSMRVAAGVTLRPGIVRISPQRG
jgi:hypothetical protein